MKTKVMRDIIQIDEEKCNGCGGCVLACAEGAIQIVDGKARLVSETYCDGLGACLGECPQGALSIQKRESEDFDEVAVEHHLDSLKKEKMMTHHTCPSAAVHEFSRSVKAPEPLPCGCPSATVQRFGGKAMESPKGESPESTLGHWPIQLTLVPPRAPFFQGADLLLSAHCAPFAYADFHRRLLANHAMVCACPKLDDIHAHGQKLGEIVRQSDIKSLTVVHMEVPCCSGLMYIAQQAIAASGKDIPLREVVIGVRGEILRQD